jgi:sugar lactone lactonase YvrE
MIAFIEPGQRGALLGADHVAAQDLGIDLTRALGYSLFDEGGGAHSVAAAILDAGGYPIGAISCPFESNDATAERLHEAGRIVAEAARRASGNVGMGLATPNIARAPDNLHDERVRVIETGRDFMGENPIWSAGSQTLCWLDILAPALRTYSPATGQTGRIGLPEMTGGLAEHADGRLILLGRNGIFEYDLAARSGRLLVSPEANRPDNRFNTAAVDADGNLWAGTMAINHEPGRGSLYRITPELSIRQALPRTGLPKNVAWSLDNRTLYYSDGADGVIYAFDFSLADGRLGNRRILANGGPDTGVPNGIAVDSEGCVWAAMLGGWAVCRYSPEGRPVEVIRLPIPMPTNLCFGGEDLRTLYVTSTYLRLPPGYSTIAPLSGKLVAINADAAGLAPRRFGAGQ